MKEDNWNDIFKVVKENKSTNLRFLIQQKYSSKMNIQ